MSAKPHRPRGGARAASPRPKFFRSPVDLRRWFERHHAGARELLVGFHRRGSGVASVTWPESVDEALCVGWIDGIRKRLDEDRYTIRFTPRRRGSIWSAVNIRRARALIREGRMRPAGLAAFEVRRENRSGIYSYERRPERFDAPYAAMIRKNQAAWRFFESRPAWYRRTAVWWVISAKREETRLRRLEQLIEHSARGRTIPPLGRAPSSKVTGRPG